MTDRRKRGRRIYTILLLLFALLIAACAAYALLQIWDFAEQYEYSRPSHAVNEYLDTINRDLWSDGIAAAVDQMSQQTQSAEENKTFVQEYLSKGVTAVRKGSSESGGINYSLRCDGKEIGTLSLEEDLSYRGKIDMKQWPWRILSMRTYPWFVESESYDFNGFYDSVSVTVPSEYSVWINGVQLGSEYIAEDNIPYDCYSEYYQYWDYLPTKVRYEYDRVLGQVEPVVKDADGREVTIDPEAGDLQFVDPISPVELQRYYDFCDPFTRQYLIYTSGLSNRAEVNYYALVPYLLPESDLAKRMFDALDGLSWGHTSSINITDVRVNSVLLLVDGYAVCDVSADVNTFTYGKGEENRTTNFRVITYDDGEKILGESLELY